MRGVSMTLPQSRRGECSVDGVAIRLRPKLGALVGLLLVADPRRFVPYDTIIEAVWPDPDLQPLGTSKVIHVMLYRARRLGIAIETAWGRGVRIPASARAPRLAPRSLAKAA